MSLLQDTEGHVTLFFQNSSKSDLNEVDMSNM